MKEHALLYGMFDEGDIGAESSVRRGSEPSVYLGKERSRQREQQIRRPWGGLTLKVQSDPNAQSGKSGREGDMTIASISYLALLQASFQSAPWLTENFH